MSFNGQSLLAEKKDRRSPPSLGRPGSAGFQQSAHGGMHSYSNTERTSDSLRSTPTLDNDHGEQVSEGEMKNGAASANSDRAPATFWVCCGGAPRGQSNCGSTFLDIHVQCDDCSHRRCSNCQNFTDPVDRTA